MGKKLYSASTDWHLKLNIGLDTSKPTNIWLDACRQGGGWAKQITGLDTSKSSVCCFIGSWVPGGIVGLYQVEPNCLYLDCVWLTTKEDRVNKIYRLYGILTNGTPRINVLHTCFPPVPSNWVDSCKDIVNVWLHEHGQGAAIVSTQATKTPSTYTIKTGLSAYTTEELWVEIHRRRGSQSNKNNVYRAIDMED